MPKSTPRAKIRKTTKRERIKARYKYILLKDYKHQTDILPQSGVKSPDHAGWYVFLAPSGLLQLRKGYRWDGCSGPTWDDRSNGTACLLHDGLYQLIRTGKLPKDARKKADRVLYFVMKEHGTVKPQKSRWYVSVFTKPLAGLANVFTKARASYYYKAVRVFGGDASRRRYKKARRMV